jgi:hypothetical protein
LSRTGCRRRRRCRRRRSRRVLGPYLNLRHDRFFPRPFPGHINQNYVLHSGLCVCVCSSLIYRTQNQQHYVIFSVTPYSLW